MDDDEKVSAIEELNALLPDGYEIFWGDRELYATSIDESVLIALGQIAKAFSIPAEILERIVD